MRWTMAVSFATVLLAGVGCSGASTPQNQQQQQPAAPAASSAPSAPAAQPKASDIKRGGVIRFRNYSTPPTLDPHRTLCGCFTSSGPGIAYSRLLHFEVGPDQELYSYQVKGDLAESWKQMNDVTWEFKLHKGVKWHNIAPVNGRELVAEDIVYSIQRQKTPGWDNAALLDPVEKVEAPDKYTVRFTLKSPNSDFLNLVADGHTKIVAKEAVESAKGDLAQGPTIGTGPFMMKQYTKDVSIKFERNPDYFKKDENGGSLPYVDGLESNIIRDDAARFAALRAKRLDYEAISPVWRETLVREKSPLLASIDDQKSATGKQFGLRVDKAPFNDVRVRQAIMFGWNREDLRKSVYRGRAWFQPGANMLDLKSVLPEDEILSKYYKHDPALSKKLLAEAGFANGIDVELTVANYGNDYASQAQLMAQQWKDVGIRATIKIIEPQVYTQQILVEGKFDMFMGPFTPVPGPNAYFYTNYHSQSERNVSRIKDPELDKMVDALLRETQVEKRRQLQLDLQRYILNDAASYNVQASFSSTGSWPYLHHIGGSGAYEYMTYAYMWLNPEDPTYAGRPK